MRKLKPSAIPIYAAMVCAGVMAVDANAQSWRSDGTSIAFDAIRERDREIYVIDTKSGGLTHFSFNRAEDFHPVWSPDGRTLLFFRGHGHDKLLPVNEQEFDIYVIDTKTRRESRITTFHGYEGDPAWAPDGRQIVFASNHLSHDQNFDIFKKPIDGKGVIRLTDNKASDFSPKFFPDAKTIVFVSRRDSYDQIYRMNADGSNQQRLLTSKNYEFHPDVSPDGKKITFASQRHVKLKPGEKPAYNPAEMEIYIANEDGTDVRRLTNEGGMDVSPVFSPDGEKILFTSRRGGAEEDAMYTMNPDGSGVSIVQVPPPERNTKTPHPENLKSNRGPRGQETK